MMAIPPNKKDDFATVLVPPLGDRDILPVLTSLLFAYPSLAQRIASLSINGRSIEYFVECSLRNFLKFLCAHRSATARKANFPATSITFNKDYAGRLPGNFNEG